MVEPITRMIYLQDEINNETLSDVISAILLFNKADDMEKAKLRNPIHLYINTFGGSVADMWSLISVIEVSKTPVYTYCTGYAMSAGFMIFIAGHKRFIGTHAQLMYHQLSSGVIGTAQEIAECFEATEQEYIKIEAYVLQHTKIPRKKLRDVKERKQDWYIDPKEAIALGIADEVMKRV